MHMKIHIRLDYKKKDKSDRRECPHCGKFLTGGPSCLRAHIRRHIGVKPMIEATAFEMLGHANAEKLCVCKICNKSFDRISKLRKHICSHGATDPLLQTRIDKNQDLCELYQITNSGGWELTLSDSETDADDSDGEDIDDEATACDSKNKSIVSHRTHTCGSCNRSFDRQYRLVVHMFFEHAKTKLVDFERFRCTSCNQLYPNDELLAKHRRNQCENHHKKCICQTCGVRFEWSTSLKLHTSKVHAKKKFQCDTCGKQFYRVQDFTRHKKSHAKKKVKKVPAVVMVDGKPVVKPKYTAGDTFIYPREFTSNAFRRVGDSKGRRGGLIKLVSCDICKKDFSRKDNLK